MTQHLGGQRSRMGGAQHRLVADNSDNSILSNRLLHIFHPKQWITKSQTAQFAKSLFFCLRIGFVAGFLCNSLAANNLPIEILFCRNETRKRQWKKKKVPKIFRSRIVETCSFLSYFLLLSYDKSRKANQSSGMEYCQKACTVLDKILFAVLRCVRLLARPACHVTMITHRNAADDAATVCVRVRRNETRMNRENKRECQRRRSVSIWASIVCVCVKEIVRTRSRQERQQLNGFRNKFQCDGEHDAVNMNHTAARMFFVILEWRILKSLLEHSLTHNRPTISPMPMHFTFIK